MGDAAVILKECRGLDQGFGGSVKGREEIEFDLREVLRTLCRIHTRHSQNGLEDFGARRNAETVAIALLLQCVEVQCVVSGGGGTQKGLKDSSSSSAAASAVVRCWPSTTHQAPPTQVV